MKQITKHSILRFFAVLVFLWALILSGYNICQHRNPIELELGMFAGSNWDVANANSYVIIDKVIAQFEEEHPGVKVHYTSGIRKSDYSEWYAQQVMKGRTPDVSMILSDDFDQLVSLGVLENLTELMQKDMEFDASEYYTTALDAGKYKDGQYAMPYETVPNLMFVNKSLLNHEGFLMPDSDWTWDDMYDICKRVTKDQDGDGRLDQFGVYNFGWQEAAYSNGAQLYDEEGSESNFTDQRVIDSVKYVKKLSDLNQGQNVSQDEFDAGNVVFMPLSFANYRTYKTYPYKIKKYTTFKWECVTMPSGPQGDNLSEVNTLLMGISKESRHKELAWELLKLFTYNKEIQMDIFRYSQGASVIRSVTNSPRAEAILSEDTDDREQVIDTALLDKIIEKGIIVPRFPKYHETMVYAEGEMDKILSDDKNVESTLKTIQRNVTSLLAQ
ncbi:MAG: sugar ABC transporter substrate-binding protein [Lachnospiraceae bacterium]|nr:sugar ABC transporter substrate-binding protein [Lachnospiraceae bacterium]